MNATIVFEKNWNAINEKTDDGKNKFRYIVNRGSSRSSKTISLIQVYDLYSRSKSNKRCTIWRDTKTDCKKTVLNDMLKTLKRERLYKVNQDFNKTESIFTYTIDSTVEIHGTDDEETVHGLTQDLAWFNEPYKISKDTFDQIDQRTSDFVFIDYNPKKGHWVEDIIKDERTIVIDSTFKDNPFCPEEQRNKILSYQPLKWSYLVKNKLISEHELKAYNFEENKLNFENKHIKEAIRCIQNESKTSANEFKWCVYGLGLKAEKPNRVFTDWEKCTTEFYLKLDSKEYFACDWGKSDPWAVVGAKVYDGCIYFHEYNYLSENQWREKMGSDDSIKLGSDTDGVGIVQWLFKRIKIPKTAIIDCDHNRPEKIAMLRRCGYENAKPAHKGRIIEGIDLLDNVQVFYTDSSENIEYELENYEWDIDRYGIVLETPVDKDNHTMDCCRYLGNRLRNEGLIKIV